MDPSTTSTSAASLHEELMAVDPIMAQRWHPKDLRKIRRSLEIYRRTGVPHSTLLMQAQQEELSDGSGLQGRAEDEEAIRCLILWPWLAFDYLDPILDKRVHCMVKVRRMARA